MSYTLSEWEAVRVILEYSGDRVQSGEGYKHTFCRETDLI